ncbi:MAG: guanylate cyclase [Proteobacteria bacterium]|nr:guanylate cyclase [Pseudomonadota bacterium]
MTGPVFERRLAAILMCDIVGYSRLMGRDDIGTLRTVKSYRARVLAPAVAAHRGRIVNMPGDSVLMEFGSVVDAVHCAVSIQRAMLAAKKDTPQDRQIMLRMGANIGDVIIDDGAIFGDGVNVAARLETLCEPGGLCVSRAAYEQVHDKLPLPFVDLGERSVKNIARPVGVFALSAQAIETLPEDAVAPLAQAGPAGRPQRSRLGRLVMATTIVAAMTAAFGGWWWLYAPAESPGAVGTGSSAGHPQAVAQERRLSIVVLPFENVSGDPGNDVYAEAITEDLITDLSRIADAFIISSNTSFTFKGRSVDARQIARQLDVRFALVGKVRRAGEELAISVSLIDGQSGGVLWSSRFERTRTDMFAFQQEVTSQIARRLNLELKQAASERASRGGPRNLDAQDYALRAWTEIWNKPQSPATNAAGLAFADKALSIDPLNADALASRSYALTRMAQFGWSDRSQSELRREALAAGERAVELDPNNADALYALQYAVRVDGDPDRSERLLQTAVNLNPNHAPSHAALGLRQILAGHPDQAHAFLAKALALSPLDPLRAVWYQHLSTAYLQQGDDVRALAEAQESIAANPAYPGGYLNAAVALAELGRRKEALAALKKHNELRPGWTIQRLKDSATITASPASAKASERIFGALQDLGMPER